MAGQFPLMHCWFSPQTQRLVCILSVICINSHKEISLKNVTGHTRLASIIGRYYLQTKAASPGGHEGKEAGLTPACAHKRREKRMLAHSVTFTRASHLSRAKHKSGRQESAQRILGINNWVLATDIHTLLRRHLDYWRFAD